MAHEVESMFSVREVPWHGLGTIVPDVLTAKEAMVAAGLDWEVDLYPLYAKVTVERDITVDGEDVRSERRPIEPREIEIEGQYAVVRDKDLSTLGVVGSQYVPIQNHRAFDFLDTLVDSGDAKYETAGSLKEGRHVFMTMKLPHQMLIGGADLVEMYLALATSHDGSLAFTAMNTAVRIVCKNTLNMALDQAKARWSIRHTESAEGRIEEARNALGLAIAYADEFEKEAEALLAQDFTKAEFEKMVAKIVPSKEQGDGGAQTRMALIGTLESSSTLDDGLRYTKWGALNAVAEFVDWIQPIRGSKTKSEAEQRTDRAWFGAGRSLKEAAHKILVSN